MQKLLESTALSSPPPDSTPEHSLRGFAGASTDPQSDETAKVGGPEYWEGLIGEEAAAKFLSLTIRTLQGWRYKGGGPRYIRVSARCIRYRRSDLRTWAEARLRSSTSDPGQQLASA